MSRDLFDRLDADLAALTRQGAHLSADRRAQHRWSSLLKRGAASVLLIVALAASLVSEFPATASGRVPAVQVAAGERV